MKKKIKHKVKPLNEKESKVIVGGNILYPQPFNPLGNDSFVPDNRIPTKEDFKFY